MFDLNSLESFVTRQSKYSRRRYPRVRTSQSAQIAEPANAQRRAKGG
jgi:hypothetical protein